MWMFAAEQPPPEILTGAIWTFYGVVVTAVVGAVALVATQVIKSRSERAPAVAPSAPSPNDSVLLTVARDLGALVQRADDSDERFDVMDRRLDAIERRLDRTDPDWR